MEKQTTNPTNTHPAAMTTPLEKLLGHLCQKEWSVVEMMVKSDRTFHRMQDHNRLLPLDHAIINNAPYNVIETFVEEWSKFDNLDFIHEVHVLHFACYMHARSGR
jgi:hypothetical protein